MGNLGLDMEVTMSSPKSTPKTNSSKSGGMEAFFNDVAKRLQETEALREGSILLRLTGTGGGEFYLECSKGTVRLSRDEGMPILVGN